MGASAEFSTLMRLKVFLTMLASSAALVKNG